MYFATKPAFSSMDSAPAPPPPPPPAVVVPVNNNKNKNNSTNNWKIPLAVVCLLIMLAIGGWVWVAVAWSKDAPADNNSNNNDDVQPASSTNVSSPVASPIASPVASPSNNSNSTATTMMPTSNTLLRKTVRPTPAPVPSVVTTTKAPVPAPVAVVEATSAPVVAVEATAAPVAAAPVPPPSPPTITPPMDDDDGTPPTDDGTTTTTPSWAQLGDAMDAAGGAAGIQRERLGNELGFSANGNTMVATAENVNDVYGAVLAYTYHNETNEWKQLGQGITRDFEADASTPDKIAISPNGKFMAIISKPAMVGSGSLVRVLALKTKKNKNNTNNNVTDDAGTAAAAAAAAAAAPTTAMIWEQLGNYIVLPEDAVALSASLTNNLVLAVGYYHVQVYQFNATASDWEPMGKERIDMYGWSVQLGQEVNNSNNNNTGGTMVLAVGAFSSAHTFRYDPMNQEWIRFGLELSGLPQNATDLGVYVSLSANGDTVAVGVANFTTGGSFLLLRTYSFDAATDDWQQMGNDLQVAGDDSSSFLFGQSFSLSANGKVLASTTQELDVWETKGGGWVTGQVRTFDFIDNDDGSGGEWIQRGEALEVGTLESEFGYRIALSEDGNRLATSAIFALNEQGISSGKLRVFEQQVIGSTSPFLP